MTEPDGPDHEAAYHDLRVRLTGLVRATSERDLDGIAPATPEWRVRDIVGHLAGVCDDVVHGRLDGIATDDWTSAQVEHRRAWSTERLIADWQEHALAVEPRLNTFPAVAVGQMLADAFTHEQDIRGALRAPGGRDTSALTIAFDWCTDRLGERLAAKGEGTLVVETETGAKTLGAGEPATHVRADRFELVRGMTGRRSRAQLRAMTWGGSFDPDALLLAAIFTPAEHDLVE